MALRDDTLRAYRDFRILDASGDEIGRSLSYWLMLNIDTRRPVRVPDEIMDMAPQNIAHVLGIKNDRLKINMKKSDSSKTFHVRQSDLDMNRHVKCEIY